MELHNLKPAKGSVKNNTRRLGRGEGSGRGGTATKGHKGQKSRSGYKKRLGFEGGQMPIQRRIPKYGFKNINRKDFKGININTLQQLADNKKVSAIDIEALIKAGLVSKNSLVKILGNGDLSGKIDVKAHAFSKSAKEKIESLGGKAEIIQ